MRSAFDVVVAGAGPAGAAAAMRLARAGCRVALVERSRFAQPRVGESLVPDVQPALAELGVWPRFLALEPVPSYGTLSLWGSAAPLAHSHFGSPWGHGWHVDRAAFDRMLATAARDAGVALYSDTLVTGVAPAPRGWTLSLRSGERDDPGVAAASLEAPLFVDATGRRARLATAVGARRRLFDRLVGIAAVHAAHDAAAQGYVMVESIADGWWYSAPLPAQRVVVMLMTDSDLCRRATLARDANWSVRLRGAATQARVGNGARLWGLRVFAAVSQRLARPRDRARWLAVGDAALAVDPVSGSGVLRALQSARSGAAAALAALGGDPLAIDLHEADGDRECARYLNERTNYYGLETRWRDAPFWRRRRPASALAA